jgi:hypothetical protein
MMSSNHGVKAAGANLSRLGSRPGWRRGRGPARALATGATALVALLATAAVASASPPQTCRGTTSAPGTLAGNYPGDVTIDGVCAVNGGPTHVHGTLTLEPNSALLAVFALNHAGGDDPSSLVVDHNVKVLKNATLFLGCLATSQPCIDDPHPNEPTLGSADKIRGSLWESQPLGVVVHNTTIGGNVKEQGGGGGFNCNPEGVFAFIQSPVFSAYEDSTIGGNLSIKGLVSCWLGVARVHIGGNAQFLNNRLADPDAIEILSNTIEGNLTCRGNSMVWDNSELTDDLFPRQPHPNAVDGRRFGQCELASPNTKGAPPGPGPF